MAVLFISHSSKDDAAASDLETWLRRHDFTDIFIDHSDISGGEKWAQALRDSAGACRVIVCLVTKQWLASDECFGEFKAAWYMGKRIIPLLAAEPGDASSRERLAKVLAEDQGLNVAPCMDDSGRLDLARDPNVERRLKEGLRAAGALAKVGLDPEAFAVDRKLRPSPFPGLTSFGDDDADAAALTVTASATGVGSIVRLGDQPGDPKQGTTAIPAGESKTFGPFPQTTWFDVVCTGGSLTYEIAISDFPSVPPAVDRIEILSQSEYDALSPPDATTLYLIVNP